VLCTPPFPRSLLASIAASLAAHGVALADTPPLTLRWQAPADCPTRAEIEAEVLRLLSPKGHFGAKLTADASTSRGTDGRYYLSLHTTQAGVEGERDLSGQTCRAVSDAAIVTMALSLDPNLALPKDFGTKAGEPIEAKRSNATAPRATPASVQHPVEVKPSERPAPRSIAVSATPAPPIRFVVRSILGWRWGTLPQSTGELGASLGLLRGRASAHLVLSLTPATTRAYSQAQPTAGGAFTMQSGELAGCWALVDSRFGLSPCVGAALIHVRAQGFNVTPPRQGSLSWTTSLFGLQATYQQTTRLTFVAQATAYAAFRQPPYAYLSGLDKIFQPERMAYQLRVGVQLQIW
jgi:hypothetical protein